MATAKREGNPRAKKPVAPKKAGRPSSYTDEVASTICSRIAIGESLRSIVKDDDMPDMKTVMRWLGDPEREGFRHQYACAREAQADALFEECLEIADDASGDVKRVPRRDGETDEVMNGEFVARSRLRVDTRKWMAGKLAPKKYGEKISAELSGPGGRPIPTSIAVTFVEPEPSDPAA